LDELPVEEIAKGFHKTKGRPTKELYTVLGALVLQETHDLSDEELVKRVAFDMEWHYALDITSESDAEKYICERTIWEYRDQVLRKGLADRLFSRLTDKLIDVFEVGTERQRLDSTHLESNMRRLGRIRIFAATIAGFLRNLKRHARDLFDQTIEEAMGDRYLRKAGAGCFSRVAPSETAKTLRALSEDLFWLVQVFAKNESVTRMNTYRLMERVLSEQCEVIDEEGERRVAVRPSKEVASDSLQNPSDPDATYDKHKGQGYQAQIMETYREEEEKADGEENETGPDLITYVEVEPAHESDAHALLPAIEETEKRGCKPQQVLADTTYGGDDNVQEAAQKHVQVIAPTAGNGKEKTDTLKPQDFEWDPDSNTACRCPNGKDSIGIRRTQEGNYYISFDRETCIECPRRTECPVKINSQSSRLRYRDKQARLAKRRAHEKTDEFRQKYRWRAGIEATMSRLKSQTGMGRLRVRGLPAVDYAVKLKALGLNILRAGRAWAARLCLKAQLFALFTPPLTPLNALGSLWTIFGLPKKKSRPTNLFASLAIRELAA
jgi:hypothetical protein